MGICFKKKSVNNTLPLFGFNSFPFSEEIPFNFSRPTWKFVVPTQCLSVFQAAKPRSFSFGGKIPTICSPGDGVATKHCCQIPRQQVPWLHVVWVLFLKQLILLYSSSHKKLNLARISSNPNHFMEVTGLLKERIQGREYKCVK